MKIISKLKEWQLIHQQLSGKTIGFVPTMGHLHDGHLSLCQQARIQNQISVVSIFINPAQFNQTNDFNSYPRTLEADIAMLTSHHVDYLLIPDANEIYADHYQVQVTETDLSHELEGKYRPGHFNGMLTVVKMTRTIFTF